MSKKEDLDKGTGPKINMDYLPEWRDDAPPSEDLNKERFAHREEIVGPSLDANSIDDFDDFENKAVLDYYGRIIGYKSEPRRKRKPRKINSKRYETVK